MCLQYNIHIYLLANYYHTVYCYFDKSYDIERYYNIMLLEAK